MSTSLSVRRQNMATGRALAQAGAQLPKITALQQHTAESARRHVESLQLSHSNSGK